MNKNKRKTKLPFCKNVRLIYWETETIDHSSALGTLLPHRLLQLQPFSSHSPSLFIWTLCLGKCWNNSQLLEQSSASRKYFQESICIYWTFMDQFRCIQVSRPTAIHLLHLDFWLCYSFSKLKCSLCSEISLVFKVKLVSYKSLA